MTLAEAALIELARRQGTDAALQIVADWLAAEATGATTEPPAIIQCAPMALPMLGPRDLQKAALWRLIDESGIDALAVPRRGKTALRERCIETHPTLFTDASFDHLWKELCRAGLVRSAKNAHKNAHKNAELFVAGE